MISRIVLAAAAAGFVYLVVRPHRDADRLLRAEEAAIARLRGLPEPGSADGYRFSRREGGGLPALVVAEPEAPDGGGVRTFATVDGTTIYELDPVVFRASPRDPDFEALRRYLAEPPGKRKARERPAWWHPLTR